MKKKILILCIFITPIIINQDWCNLPARIKTATISQSNSSSEIQINAEALKRIDSIVRSGIQSKAFPGCQVLVIKDGKTLYDKCFGTYTYESNQKVTATTMYDLASLSKTTGTLLAIMKLYDEGKLKLTDKASYYLKFLRETDKESITISELLLHESGLPAGLPFYKLVVEKNVNPVLNSTNKPSEPVKLNSKIMKYKYDWVSNIPTNEYSLQVSDSFYVQKRFHQAAMQMIANTRLKSKTYVYSCINFILLKEIVEAINGIPLDVYLDKEFYIPMKLNNIAYLPLRKFKKENIAPTLKRDFLRNGIIQGFVHDPDAALLGGVSGNAGLFANSRDVARVYQMLLNQGELNDKRYLSKETCNLFTTITSANKRRGLGFDKPTPHMPNSPCCDSAPETVYGHTGYTGTCCWVDPTNKLIYVFLSNRTYPSDGTNKLARMGIRTKIQEAIYQSLK